MSRKLEIGSGNRPLEGYEHLDINPDCPCVEYVASMDKIPVENDTFDKIKAVHVIEHQPWKDTLATLTEWTRVLKPGGVITIATPNLRWIAQSYIDARAKDETAFREDVRIMTSDEKKTMTLDDDIDVAFWANFKIMSSGGKWDQHFACYDADLLGKLLILAGCSRTEVQHDGDSLIMKGFK